MCGVRYSVYRTKTDEPVCIHGTRQQCANAMKVTLKGFDSIASRQRHNHKKRSQKWEIIREESDDEETG